MVSMTEHHVFQVVRGSSVSEPWGKTGRERGRKQRGWDEATVE